MLRVDASQQLATLVPGRLFHDRYEIVRCLKAGGMGAIYEVTHRETRRRRALKVMLPSMITNGDMQARFRLEATVAADIESEHIVETFDAGVDAESGFPFLVMELLRGQDLGAVIQEQGKLEPAEVVNLLGQVANALDKTHAAGVVHRDLKPENLFVTRRDDGSPKVKILDFGIAKVVSESGQAAARTKILGTPLYMSPEQIRGEGTIGGRSDLYALAHIAFALIVGTPYWFAEAQKDELYALMMQIVAGGRISATQMAAKYQAKLPAEFDAWFARATAPDPSERFSKATELVESLARVFDVAFARVSTSIKTTPKNDDPGSTRPLLDGPARAGTPEQSLSTPFLAKTPVDAATKPKRPIALIVGAIAVIGVAAIGVRSVMGSGTAKPAIETPVGEPTPIATASESAVVPTPSVAPSGSAEPTQAEPKAVPEERTEPARSAPSVPGPPRAPAARATSRAPAPKASAVPSAPPSAPQPKGRTID